MTAATPYQPVQSPAVWLGRDLVTDPAQWTTVLTEAHREEIAAAARPRRPQVRPPRLCIVAASRFPDLPRCCTNGP
ncbi:hypothetical protein [Nocardia sp. NPDC020380]|uniref:hypothetical protein n=1 Tax=Nocardia sp. NPDC020380 TaxID=3364309 RepID=UPI0037AD64C2